MRYDFSLKLGRMFALSKFIKDLYHKVYGMGHNGKYRDYMKEAKELPVGTCGAWRYGYERHWMTMLMFDNRYGKLSPEDSEKFQFAYDIVEAGSYLDSKFLPFAGWEDPLVIEKLDQGYNETMEELKRRGWD